MHTLNDLKAGKLVGQTRVKIACGLSEFPDELFDLAETLEVLDLSGNRLHSLPDKFASFKKLRILFLSDNEFDVLPEVLGQCPQLSMVGFKANRIASVPASSLPKMLRWLILTDNRIEALPDSIGDCRPLQKLMLAGNQLKSLPRAMAQCVNLQLLRISANQIDELPDWLFSMPKLSWLAFAGNPCCCHSRADQALEEIHWNELHVNELLGEGASGLISKAYWQDHHDVAVKVFKGAITSDGLPADEMAASIAAGQHDNLVEVLGQLVGHPQEKSGLLLSLIADDFKNLAGPPSLDSCTRDVYSSACAFTLQEVDTLITGIASAAAHLHERSIMHGDLYGHNILVNDRAECLLGDFGAATFYGEQSPLISAALERLEVRAFGCLLEELLQRVTEPDDMGSSPVILSLQALLTDCMSKTPSQRPSFSTIYGVLLSLRLDRSRVLSSA